MHTVFNMHMNDNDLVLYIRYTIQVIALLSSYFIKFMIEMAGG